MPYNNPNAMKPMRGMQRQAQAQTQAPQRAQNLDFQQAQTQAQLMSTNNVQKQIQSRKNAIMGRKAQAPAWNTHEAAAQRAQMDSKYFG